MTEYCVYLPLEVDSFAGVQELRERFDPLARLIPPHVTLVFPFKADLSVDVISGSISRALESFTKISFRLGRPKFVDSYAWFPISEGQSELRRLHAAMYAGELKQFCSLEINYEPHVTFGRYKSQADAKPMQSAADQLPLDVGGVFSDLVLESIAPNGCGTVERTWTLT